jgi:hypothetical protein
MATPTKRRVLPVRSPKAKVQPRERERRRTVPAAATPAPASAAPKPAAPVDPNAPQFGAAQRWTDDLVKDGFTPISDYFLKNYAALQPPIGTAEAMFIVHLMSFKWTRKAPRPSMRRIAERMAVSEVSVRGYARSLEEKKYLQRVMRVGRTNQFRLRPLFEVLEAHRLANQKPVEEDDEIDD